uniref:Putative ribonuclease H-like domain-containing protein n=1 Tax=Tanacetum cinerariifolium TaxID=118510 RepID=A0A6L2NUE7_TANCI|nr:putative ribonuclease H-like domain-containing protein [Tanacetum cinerariifolium]
MFSPNYPTSNTDDAFSSNFFDYTTASPGNISPDPPDNLSKNLLASPPISPFYNVQAYNTANKPHIPSPDPITTSVLLTPSSVLPPSPLFDPRRFFVPEDLLPPKTQIHHPSSSSTTLSNLSQKQACVKPSTSASGSQLLGNTKKDKIQRPPSSTQKNKVEANPRIVKSSLKNKKCAVEPKGTAIRKVWKQTSKVFTKTGYTWRPNGQTFTIVGNAYSLTRITTTAKDPHRKPTDLETNTPKPVVTLVYSRKPRKTKTNVPISKPKIIKSISANNMKPSTIKFRTDHVEKIMGYGDYHIRNAIISRVYYVEGLGHNLFSIGQFCDSNLQVAFCQHTCFIRNLEGDDLLTGSRGNNLYTLSLGYMKSKKKPHKPKSEDTNQKKLYLLHMDLCGPMRVTSVNEKKYILVIVDDYSRFTWVKFLRTKDEGSEFIIKSIKMIQVRLKTPVYQIRTDNETEFVNQTLREYYEKVGISHETSVSCSPKQNGVVERCNCTLIEAARTISELALHEMTPAIISSGLLPNPSPSTSYVPPLRTDWDILFQPLFDELLTPPPSVNLPTLKSLAQLLK